MSDSMDDDQQQGGGGGGGRPKVVITTRHAREAAAAASGGAAGGASSSGGADGSSRQTKGRGFQSRYSDDSSAAPQGRYSGRGGEFESIDAHSGGSDAQKSIEGWILVLTGLHEETNEDDLYELCADHGDIKQLHLNLDRRTGYVKGYALVEYAEKKEAQSAIEALNGQTLHDKTITVDWAFKVPPGRGGGGGRAGRGPRR